MTQHPHSSISSYVSCRFPISHVDIPYCSPCCLVSVLLTRETYCKRRPLRAIMQVVNDLKEYEGIQSTLLPWLVCFAATLLFFFEFIQGNMFASIAADIMQDYHVQAIKWLICPAFIIY